MNSNELWKIDASAQSAKLQEGEITSSDLVEMYLARCEQLNPSLNAFTFLDVDGSRTAAATATQRQKTGKRIGPLDGIPVVVKDNIFVKGMPAAYGSRLYRDHIPDRDDICIERLRAAGAIILGKTTTPEFALAGRTESRLHGVTKSPWDPTLTPGGSSGGSVVAVAAGMAPLALGTDAGGSTRMPASYNGLFGLRSSNGRIPRRYGFPPMSLDFQVIGLLTRSTRDLSFLYDVLAYPDERDPLSQRVPGAQTQIMPLRLGWYDTVEAVQADAEVRSSVARAIEIFDEAGHETVRITAPYAPSTLNPIWDVLTTAGAARMANRFPDRWETEMDPNVVEIARRGMNVSGAEYAAAIDDLNEFRALTAQNWGDFDALVSPAAAAPSWPINDLHPKTIGGAPGSVADQGSFCGWVNAMGYPAVSVPIGYHPDGRPIGVQIISKFGADAVVMELAQQLETRFSEQQCWPAFAQTVRNN